MADRAELKRQYKDSTPQMGVFVVRNQVSGKVLLGASLNIPGSFNRVRFQLQNGSHMNADLQRDWNTQGADSFAFEVLDELKPVTDDPARDYREDVAALKSLWLEKLQPYGEAGYNARPKSASS